MNVYYHLLYTSRAFMTMEVPKFSLLFVTVVYFENCLCFNFDLNFVDVIKSDVSDSYFGYSVLLQKGSSSSSVLIGAPKANSSYPNHAGIEEPGALYSCDIGKPNSCKQYIIDREGNLEYRGVDNRFNYKNRKDHGLLGAAIDGGEGENDPVIVCSPRWVNNRRDRNGQHYLANGICYLINSRNINQTGEKLMPLLDAGKQGYTLDEVKYYYAIGEAGISVKYIQTEKQLLLGAPGVLSWKGTVIKYDSIDSSRVSFRRATVPNPVYMTSIREENSYLGYSLSYGTFDLRYPLMWYVAGAPRAEELTGTVILFEFPYEDDSDLIVRRQMVGDQLGSYFGSALLSTDITGNGVSDLLVGAPTYNLEKWDEGCVYFYKNLGNANFEEPYQIYGSKQAGARFGSAISSLGDINHDLYNDVAIAAPYEDDHGVVYIYLGGKDRLSLEYSQRIEAKSISNNLKGFGFTISKALDIDRNSHNDIAIGAYKSGEVAIIKSRPIIRYSAKLIPSVKELPVDSTIFNVTYCITYHGTLSDIKLVDTYINIVKDYRAVNNNNISHTIRLGQGSDYCDFLTVLLRGGNLDYSKLFTIEMFYGILDNAHSEFCATCPVVDPAEKASFLLNIPFANGCGEDNICRPDLKISAKTENNLTSLVIGSQTTLKLLIQVENKNETAYLCQIRMKLPPGIEVERISSRCDLSEDKIYTCLVDNALQPDTQKEIIFDLDIKRLDLNEKYISFNLTVDSRGEEINWDDNTFLLVLPLQIENDVDLSGFSTPDQIAYVDEDSNIKSEIIDFQHVFTLKNLGPSPLLDFNVEFYVPVETDVGVIFQVYEPEVKINSQPLVCTTNHHLGFISANSNTSEIDNKPTTEVLNRLRRNSDDGYNKIDMESLLDLPINRTLFINCSNSVVTCMKITCPNKSILHRNQNFQAKLRIKAQIGVLEKILNNKDIIFLSSTAEAKVNEKILLNYANTLLIGSLAKEQVSYWIYIICVIAALVILTVLVFILYKLNFFNRPVREKLKEEADSPSGKGEIDDDDHDHEEEISNSHL